MIVHVGDKAPSLKLSIPFACSGLDSELSRDQAITRFLETIVIIRFVVNEECDVAKIMAHRLCWERSVEFPVFVYS